MFLSKGIDIKLCQNYTIFILCQILYKSCSIKQMQELRNQSEKDYIPQEPDNIRFAPIMIF